MVKESEYKKGDKLLLSKSNNGANVYDGSIVEISSVGQSSMSVVVLDGKYTGQAFTMYTRGPADEFCIADRTARAEFYEKKAIKLHAEADKCDAEAIALRKYKDDEDEMAAKLDALLNAKGPKQMAEILRTLKKSNYL